MTTEPRVEELLATIRRAIDRDINELDARDMHKAETPLLRGTLVQDPMPQPRVHRDADSEISSLRQRVQRHKLDVPPAPPKPVPQAVQSLYLPQPRAEEPVYRSLPEPLPSYEPEVEAWPVEDMQPVENHAESDQQALISHQAAYAAQASFQALANAMMGQLGGDEGLQDTARGLLRPMLKQWLDDNLPSLVERLVRDEIERVARRGR